MKTSLYYIIFYSLLVGFGIPAVNYYSQQKHPTEAGPYDFWDGVIVWILASLVISSVGEITRNYFLKRYLAREEERQREAGIAE